MNTVEIHKMQKQQTAKLEELRNIVSQEAKSNLSAAQTLIQLNNGFWLSEIALQLARRNDLLEVQQGIRPVNTINDPDARSLWERVFGHKANEFGRKANES